MLWLCFWIFYICSYISVKMQLYFRYILPCGSEDIPCGTGNLCVCLCLCLCLCPCPCLCLCLGRGIPGIRAKIFLLFYIYLSSSESWTCRYVPENIFHQENILFRHRGPLRIRLKIFIKRNLYTPV